MITKQHTYNPLYKIIEALALLMSLVSVFIGALLFISLIVSLFSGERMTFYSVLTFLGNFLGYSIWSPVVFLFGAYLFTDIRTDNNGLHLRFLWKKYTVKWVEIIEIKSLKSSKLFNKRTSSIVVVKSKLTLIHRLYGLLFGRVNQPAIVVYWNISDYLLIRNIYIKIK